MISESKIREIALSFPEVNEAPHFEKTSFRAQKKIFASYSTQDKRACLKLSEIDQSVFSTHQSGGVYPVPNKWGKQGWTFIELKNIKKEMLTDALTTAYCSVAPKRLTQKYSDEE